MSKFLDSTGLSRLVENIKNKFQPKPFLLELSVSYDRQTNEGSVSIREDDIARAFDHLYKYKDSSDYNISFKVYHSNYECTYICKANSITFQEAYFNINVDCNLHLADDKDQIIGHIRLSIDAENVEGYYDEQNIIYDNSVLLTGTGVALKKTHCKLWDNGGYWTITIDNNDYEIIRDGAALYEVLKDKLNDLTFDIKFNRYISLYNVNYNINKNDDGSIDMILTGFAYSSYDEPLINIVQVGIWLYEDTEGDCIISKGIDIEINNLNKVNNLITNGYGTYILNDKGEYSINDIVFIFNPEGKYIETVDPYDNSTQDRFMLDSVSEMKNFFTIFHKWYSIGSIIKFKLRYENHNNIVIPKIMGDNSGYTIICTFMYDNNPDDDVITICKTSFDFTKNGNCQYYGVQECRVSLDNLRMVEYLDDTGNSDKFLTNAGVYAPTSILLTFEAENGNLTPEHVDGIEEGYYKNLPIYVLYSGIKMLVNGIQKLGDIYSLSCRHDNSTYSITMNLDDDSYEISSISD